MTWLQQWMDVLFLHFPASAAEVQRLLPRGVEVDTYRGQAWISYVFFRLRLRPAWLPLVPGFSSLLELNVRTYVRNVGQPGICFLRMYADNRLAIGAARLLTPLCYEPARMIDERRADGSRHIECHPVTPGAGSLSMEFAIGGTRAEASAASLDAWLLERYWLFVGRSNGRVLAGEVEHPPWQASPVHVTTLHHAPVGNLGITIDEKPAIMHHSPGVAARFKSFQASPAPLASDDTSHAFAGVD